MIEKFAKLIPQDLKKKSGAVFYTGSNAFNGPKELYILGLNPGGNEINQKDETIEWHTNKILNGNSNFSEYIDESWLNHKPGTFRMQPRVLHVLKQLKLDPHLVPSSNVCFVRSAREKNIASQINYYMELCWPLHKAVIHDLNIKVILCMGKTAGHFVKNKLNATVEVGSFIEDNNRKWKTQAFKNNFGQIVVIASHPSIADWTKKNTDISKLVKDQFH